MQEKYLFNTLEYEFYLNGHPMRTKMRVYDKIINETDKC